MKKLFFLLVAASGALTTTAQHKHRYTDTSLSRWVIDINALGGFFTQNLTANNSSSNYPNALNYNGGELKFARGGMAGFNGQVGYFFGKRRHFGLSAGFMYMGQWGSAELDKFHVEYQSTDYQGNIFRQLVTGKEIKEDIKIVNYNIPIMLKYKKRFSDKWGLTADAGVLVNLLMQNKYTTKASFDYEAIYKFNKTGDGATVAVYDNSPVPQSGDWLITKDHFNKNNPGGNVDAYFNQLKGQGYNVGLGVTPKSKSGTVDYTKGSVGLLLQPAMSYYFSERAALNLGVYYLYQPFSHTVNTGYQLTNAVGDYTSVLDNVKAGDNMSFGVNVGMRFFLGKKKNSALVITSIDGIDPSTCGTCDGSMIVHGLTPNQPVTVNYSMNNDSHSPYYTGTTDAKGDVAINGFCAGTYSDITAKIGKRSAKGNPVTLNNPRMEISSENITNPTATGTCDGSITINGLTAGQSVTVNYMRNGNAQSAQSVVVNSDRTVKLTGLCAGTYSGIVVTANGCTANGADITLADPAPPLPPPAEPTKERIDVSTPILFNLNKTTVKETSYPVLDEAVEELKENKNAIIVVDGYTDATGSKAYNQKLSVKRAVSVKNELKKRGVNPNRVKAVGHGEEKPTETNNTPEGRMQNRRAVMKLK